jgi:hypothetical protein
VTEKTDLEVRAGQPADVVAAQAESALARLEHAAPEEAKAIRDDADLLHEVLRKRGWALESINPLAELKVTAERKIGEVRAAMPRRYRGAAPSFDWDKARELLESGASKKLTASLVKTSPQSLNHAKSRGWQRTNDGDGEELRQFDEVVGIKPNTGTKWQRLAAIPAEEFTRIIQEIKEDEEEITTSRVLYRYGHATGGGVKVDPGIYLLPDGRHVIRYRQRGGSRQRQETLETRSLEVARKTLLRRRGLLTDKSATAKIQARKLDHAYSDLRSCLARVDKLLPGLKPDARRHAHAVLAQLHKAEDELMKAIHAENT